MAEWPSDTQKYWLILSVLKQRIDQGFDHGSEKLRQVLTNELLISFTRSWILAISMIDIYMIDISINSNFCIVLRIFFSADGYLSKWR